MTVEQLRHLLFKIEDQNKEVMIRIDKKNGNSCIIARADEVYSPLITDDYIIIRAQEK